MISWIFIDIILFVVSFFLGAIPWGVVVSKFVYKQDVRDFGSGNIGTTNMMRAFGKKAGIAVFVLDFAKGFGSGLIALAVFEFAIKGTIDVASQETVKGIMLATSFAGSVWGHIFSPFLGFKGGKGIATAVANEFVSITPIGAIIELLIFGVLVATTKYVSVGSIAAALACLPLSLYFFWGNPVAWVLMSAAALTVAWAHRGNFKRLCEGTERRVGDKKQ